MIKNYLIQNKANWRITILLIFIFSGIFTSNLFAQNEGATFPKIKASVGIVHPIVTFTSDEITTNFKDHYVVGMPIALNLWKNKAIGFSFEIVPTIRSENGISKVSNILIHPGILVRLKNEFTFAGRIAFETSGRYGFTPVLSKAIGIHKDYNYYVSVPLPVRFGNEKPISLTAGLQFGISF